MQEPLLKNSWHGTKNFKAILFVCRPTGPPPSLPERAPTAPSQNGEAIYDDTAENGTFAYEKFAQESYSTACCAYNGFPQI